MKKKILSLVLTTALAVTALAGCGSTKTEDWAKQFNTIMEKEMDAA